MPDLFLIAADDAETLGVVLNAPLKARNDANQHRQDAEGAAGDAERDRELAEEARTEAVDARDKAVAAVSGLKDLDRRHGSAASLARALLGTTEDLWGLSTLEETESAVNAHLQSGVLTLGSSEDGGVGTFILTLDLNAAASSNPLFGAQSACFYFLADAPWSGTVEVIADYSGSGGVVIADGGNQIGASGEPQNNGIFRALVVRDQLVVLEEVDRPAGATKLRLTFNFEVQDAVRFAAENAFLGAAPFAETEVAALASAAQPKRLSVITVGGNLVIGPQHEGALLNVTNDATVTLGDGLNPGFTFHIAVSVAGREATLSATTLLPTGPNKLGYGSSGRVTYIGAQTWVTDAELTS